MKKLLILFTLLFAMSTAFGADANPTFEVGSMTIDGGQGHLAYMTGFEMNVKATETGFRNYVRSGIYQIRNNSPEAQGAFVWDITEQVLKTNWWNLYGAFGFGLLNQVNNGDDTQNGGTMLEFGCELFNKMPFGVGAKLFPVDGKGDKVFVYGKLSFKLP